MSVFASYVSDSRLPLGKVLSGKMPEQQRWRISWRTAAIIGRCAANYSRTLHSIVSSAN
jgi:hypothetical protein